MAQQQHKEGYEEASPLLQPPSATQPQQQQPAAQPEARKWSGHLLLPFGDCSPLHWATCVVTWYLPCVSHALTQRAFGRSALRAGLTFGFLVLLAYLHRGLQVALLTNECIAFPPEFRNLSAPRSLGPGWGHDGGPDMLTHVRTRAAKPFGAPIHPAKAGTERCERLINSGLVLNFMFLAYFIALVVYGARLRGQIRERFGISGAAWKDVLAWCCCTPCAVMQEARTVHANVDGGIWHRSGAGLPVYAASETAAPSVPVMSMPAAAPKAQQL